MLTQLHIENVALIKKLDIELSEGFTVFTGETGAGKSILIGALSFLLGGTTIARNIPKIDALSAYTTASGSMFPATIPADVPMAQSGIVVTYAPYV